MNWMDSPPALDRAHFFSNLTQLDSVSDISSEKCTQYSSQFLADKLAESFFSTDNIEHKVSVVELKWVCRIRLLESRCSNLFRTCVLQGRSLEAAIALVWPLSPIRITSEFSYRRPRSRLRSLRNPWEWRLHSLLILRSIMRYFKSTVSLFIDFFIADSSSWGKPTG